MIIKCHGARGSLPVSGREYLEYGGDTTCLEIRSAKDEIIIVDAGSGIRKLGNLLLKEKRRECNLLFTHSHWDHVLGFPFFKPIYMKGFTIRLRGCPNAQGNIKKLLSQTMSMPFFPVPFNQISADIKYEGLCPTDFKLGSIRIESINLSHTNPGLGFRFSENGRTFVFLTDNELGYCHRGGRSLEEYVAFAKGADVLFHDAEYTPEEYEKTRTWGHSTFVDALNLALEAGVKSFGLFHHNQDRGDEGLAELVENCRKIIASSGSTMDCFAVNQETEIRL